METGKVFRWCFIGCGRLARTVAGQLASSGRHTVVSAYTRRPEACREFTDEFGGTPYSSAREAICAEGVDAVYIVTPHRSHYEYARLALECGKPVLCEKAFTVTRKDAEELIRLSEEKKLYLAEAMWTWFAPVGNRVRRWVQEGNFGEVRECTVDCRTDAEKYAARVTDPEAAGGALLDMGVYAVYYLYKLFGKPEKIECTGDVHDGIDWKNEIRFTYPGGRKYLAMSSVNDEGVIPSMKLVGSKASITVTELQYAGYAGYVDADGNKHEIEADGSYLNEFDIVAAEIRKGLCESQMVTHEDTLTVMGILDECRRQMGLKYDFE